MMPLPEEGKEKISIESDEKVAESSKVPNAASSSSQPSTKSIVSEVVDFMVNAVEKCLQDEKLDVDAFVDMYSRFMRLFEPLGSVYGFIAREIYEQVNAMRMFRNGEDKERFQTIESALQGHRDSPDDKFFVAEHALLRLSLGVPVVSGSLRLIHASLTGKSEDRMVAQAKEVFNTTVAEYFGEETVKIVNALLALFPTNDFIVKQLVGGDRADMDHLLVTLPALSDRLDHLFEVVKKLSSNHGLLYQQEVKKIKYQWHE